MTGSPLSRERVHPPEVIAALVIAYEQGRADLSNEVDSATRLSATVDAERLRMLLQRDDPGHGRSYRLRGEETVPLVHGVELADEDAVQRAFEIARERPARSKW